MTATLEQPDTGTFADLTEIEQALKRGKRRDELRAFALSSTSNLAKVVGINPWDITDLNNQVPMQDPETGWYPWAPYLEDTTRYLDSAAPGIAKPVKPVFVARDHHKSTAAAVSLALRGLKFPQKSNVIFCDSEIKSSIRLGWISDIYKSDVIQWLFPERVFPDDGKSRYRYNDSEIIMRQPQMHASRPTFSIFGLKTPTAGAHFSGVCLADDLVNEENHRNPEIQASLWLKLQAVYQFVLSPGCELWITGTRYSRRDAYSNVLDEDSPLRASIVPGRIMLGDKDENGWDGEALNVFRFCVRPKDKTKPVVFHGTTFYPIRESLQEKKASTNPVSEYFAQMENNPTAEGNCSFKESQFKQVIPCNAEDLRDWISKAENIREYILKGKDLPGAILQRAPIKVGILGDIAYADRPQNDFSWLLVIAADTQDDWYLMDGFKQRKSVEHGGLNVYFGKAFAFRDQYGVSLPLAIELHAKESTGAAATMIAESLGVRPPTFHPLKDNSIKNKEVRISNALETQASAMKLYICQDFPKDVLDELVEQAISYPNGKRDDGLDTLANARQLFPALRRKKIKGDRNMYSSFLRNLPTRVRRFL